MLTRLLKRDDRRRSPRRLINRIAKIWIERGALPRDCLVTDISDGGVRLHVEKLEVPDTFTLCISGDGVPQGERPCRVMWRLGFEIGAKFVDPYRDGL